MRRLRNILILLLLSAEIFATKYYVSTTGNDSNTGLDSTTNAFLTWQHGVDQAVAGDSVIIRGGTYLSYLPCKVTESGTSFDNQIWIGGHAGDIANDNWPILDCRDHCANWPNPWPLYNAGIQLTECQYIHLENLEVMNVLQCDSNVTSGGITAQNTANITYEELRVHDIGQRGYWHTSGAWSSVDSTYAVDVLGQLPSENIPYFAQPDTTRWINCDTWNCCDSLNNNPGNAGDAIKAIGYVGNTFYWDGCRQWAYSDDGIDPNKCERIFTNCWVMPTRKYASFGIEGNGIKSSAMQSEADANYHNLAEGESRRLTKTKGCLALYCPNVGFYHGVESDTTDNAYWINNTAWKCGRGYASDDYELDSIGDIFRNNLVYGSTGLSAIDEPFEVTILTEYEESHNVWDKVRSPSYPGFVMTDIVTVTEADFDTVDSLTLVARFTAPRNTDGSLPPFPLQLVASSDLIDAGTQISSNDESGFDPLSFSGDAPDIGAFEYGVQAVNDSIILTTTQHLTDSLASGNRSGQTVYIGMNTISGNYTIGTTGVTIRNRPGYSPAFSGKVIATGSTLNINNMAFNGGLELQGDGVNVNTCTFATADTLLTINQATAPVITNNTFTGPVLMYHIVFPDTDWRGEGFTINNNTYNISTGTRLNGFTFTGWRMHYNYWDQNSTFNRSQ